MTLFIVFAVAALMGMSGVEDRCEILAFIVGLYLIFLLAAWLANLRFSFFRDHLVLERGLGCLRRARRVDYHRIGRVRGVDGDLTAEISLVDGGDIRIYGLYVRVTGELPEVEFKEGASAQPHLVTRRIVKLVEERVARARAERA